MSKELLLETQRLWLRPLSLADVDALYAVYRDPQTMRYWVTPPHPAPTFTRHLVERTLQNHLCSWVIVLKENEQAIGEISYLGNVGAPGMGYILHAPYWRQGFMTEAATAALDAGFTTLGLDRVELWINEENIASQRLAQRLGFTRRGCFRQKYQHETTSHQKEVYGLLATEWRRSIEQPAFAALENHFYSVQPILAVPDVQATAEYYRDQLGFAIDFLFGEPPTHGAVSRGLWATEGVRLQLSQLPSGTPLQPQTALYLFVGPTLDALYTQLCSNGVTIDYPPTSFPWGMREFAIRDCNDYRLRFGTPS